MGAEESRLADTNWDTADGGLSPNFECITGDPPTSKAQTVTIKKKKILDNHNYSIIDADGTTLYYTISLGGKVVGPGYKEVFDLQSGGHKAARIKKDKIGPGDAWTIYALEPAFEGQEADPEAHLENELKGLGWLPKKTEKYWKDDPNVRLYKTYHVKLDPAKNFVTVESYISVRELKPVLKIEKVKSLTKDIFQGSLPGETSLVSYWDWHNTASEHKMELQLAKGVDLGLHASLAVLVNLVGELGSGQFA